MVKTLSINTDVPANREVIISIPADIPIGPAEIVVVIASKVNTTTKTLGELLNSEFFGMWKDRSDIEDSVEFAHQLRTQAWSRAA
jgi:hypothetical protein